MVGSTVLDKDKQNHITLTVIYSISTHPCFCQSWQRLAPIRGKEKKKEEWGGTGEGASRESEFLSSNVELEN